MVQSANNVFELQGKLMNVIYMTLQKGDELGL